MAVRVQLTSGGQRVVEAADDCRCSGEFFIVTRRWSPDGSTQTLLTLRAQDVIGAEVVTDGVVTGYVPGKGTSSTGT